MLCLTTASCVQSISIANKTSPLKNPIRVNGWEVGCEQSLSTSKKTCYLQQYIISPAEYDITTSLSVIRLEEQNNGPVLNFSHNSSEEIPGQVKIDDNPTISYKGEHLTTEQSKVLINEMLKGDYGHVVTYNQRNQSHSFGFSLSGFKQAYAKLLEIYVETKTQAKKK